MRLGNGGGAGKGEGMRLPLAGISRCDFQLFVSFSYVWIWLIWVKFCRGVGFMKVLMFSNVFDVVLIN